MGSDGLSEQTTQVSHRQHLLMTVEQADELFVSIAGSIQATSLSEQQALFSDFKTSLLSVAGVSELVEEQTPVTQWRMPNDANALSIDIALDSFSLRFKLSDVAS